MTDGADAIRPEAGADDDKAKIWADLGKADAAASAEPKEPSNTAGVSPPADPAPAADKAAGDAGTEAAPVKDAAPAPDIWATATPEQRAAFEATRKEADTNATRLRDSNARLTAHQRKIEALQRGNGAGKPAPAAADGGDRPASVFETPAFKKAKDEYPELLGPVEEALRPLEERTRKLDGEIGGLTSAHREQYLAEQYQAVLDAHPDYERIAKSPEFATWYEQAPAYIKAGVERNAKDVVDGAEVASIVKQYKADTGLATTSAPGTGASATVADAGKRQRQLASATTPRGKAQPVVTSAIPEDREGAWRHWQEVDRRQATQP